MLLTKQSKAQYYPVQIFCHMFMLSFFRHGKITIPQKRYHCSHIFEQTRIKLGKVLALSTPAVVTPDTKVFRSFEVMLSGEDDYRRDPLDTFH